MAIGRRRPQDVIRHSGPGSQCTSVAFGLRCKEAGVRPSTGSVGDACDNAMRDGFFATLDCEPLDGRKFAAKAAARMARFEFIEGWRTPSRRHSALGCKRPITFERDRQEQLRSAIGQMLMEPGELQLGAAQGCGRIARRI